MNRFIQTVAATAIVFGATAVQAADLDLPSGAYNLDKTHASVTWTVSHFGLSNYTARFTNFDIDLNLNTNNIENSSVSASIDVLSVETDYPGEVDFDREISSDPKFLNASAFPEISYTSNRIERTGDNTARIHGTMTMLGVTKPLVLDATLNGSLPNHPYAKVPAVGFSAIGTVKRSEFGFDHLIPYVGDDVTVRIEAEFLQAK